MHGIFIRQAHYFVQLSPGNHHGLIANVMVSTADGYAEREAAKTMINDARQAATNPEAQITLGADKGYDAQEFMDTLQEMSVVPHVAQNTSARNWALPDAIAASAGYAISVQKRKLIEQGFGWDKTVARIRQVMVHGLKKVGTNLCADHDCLQPHAHALPGKDPPTDNVKGRKCEETRRKTRKINPERPKSHDTNGLNEKSIIRAKCRAFAWSISAAC